MTNTSQKSEFKVSPAKAVLTVLEKVAADNAFFIPLAGDPIKAMSSFGFTSEQSAARASGGIAAIEEWVGPLEECLKISLMSRLEMERW